MAIGSCVYDIRDVDVYPSPLIDGQRDAIYGHIFWWRGVHRAIMGIFYATYANCHGDFQSDDSVCRRPALGGSMNYIEL